MVIFIPKTPYKRCCGTCQYISKTNSIIFPDATPDWINLYPYYCWFKRNVLRYKMVDCLIQKQWLCYCNDDKNVNWKLHNRYRP